MDFNSISTIGSLFFALAIIHTFLTPLFQRWANLFKEGSIAENLFHLLGEVEVIFGIWAAFFCITISFTHSASESLKIIEDKRYAEPIFIFIIMAISSTRPLLNFSERIFIFLSKALPLQSSISLYLILLGVAPFLGSLITEPAAMTVIALCLKEMFFDKSTSEPFKYATLALLFLNVSIGGTLTNFAAPPILMVAHTWSWSSSYVLSTIGLPALISAVVTTTLIVLRFKDDIVKSYTNPQKQKDQNSPTWIIFVHLSFLFGVVLAAHHPALAIFIFLFFVGFAAISQEHQSPLKFKESLLVSFFLGGLVILGSYQQWWLEPLITQLSSFKLFLGAIGLTAITDNAALTFLGAQVPGLSEETKIFLVSGAVVGGGLTVIANAPNPIGYSVLASSFSNTGINALKLIKAGLIPTMITAIIFYVWIERIIL